MPQFDAFGNIIPDQQMLAMTDPRMQIAPDLQLQDIQAAELPAGGKSIARKPSAGGGITKANAFAPAYADQFDNAFNENMGLRQDQLAELRSKLQATEEAKPTGLQAVNLKPLAAFADSLTGGDTAANFQEETSTMKNYKIDKQKLQDSIDKNSGVLADDQLAYLRMKAQEEAQKSAYDRMASSQAKTDRSNEFRLREKWDADPITKNSKAIAEGYQKIQGTGGNNASDLSLIYGLMRLQDPGSVVRESEADMAAKIGGFPEQTQALFSQLSGTGKLTPEQRASIKREAEGLYRSQLERQALVDSDYRRMAIDYGYNPDNVVLSKILQPTPSKDAPGKPSASLSPGTIDGGYRFKGGNPKDKNNWEKL